VNCTTLGGSGASDRSRKTHDSCWPYHPLPKGPAQKPLQLSPCTGAALLMKEEAQGRDEKL